MRYLTLVAILLLFSYCRLFAQEDEISIISNVDADGYCGTETPLKIKFAANVKFATSRNCELQCSFDGRNTWNTIKHYEGSITQNCTLQVQYPDMLPTATDDCYFNNMGKDIYLRIKQGTMFSTEKVAKFVCKPKYKEPVPVYRTIEPMVKIHYMCV